jgi:hypothetical protein
MEDFTLPSFKKWGAVHPFFQNPKPIPKLPKIKNKKTKKIRNRGVARVSP